jgi:hypothetical protein
MPITAGITSAFYGQLAKPFGYNALRGAQGLAFGHATAPFISAYPFSTPLGVGTKYANPATALTSQADGIAFNSLGNSIILVNSASPFVHAYAWSNTTGFGTKFAAPATIGRVSSHAVSIRNGPSQDQVAVVDQDGGAAQYIRVWNFLKTGGWGATYGNPASLPTSQASGVKFNPSGSALTLCTLLTPFIVGYPWSGSGFGTRYANPATLPPIAPSDITVSRLGGAVFLAHGFSGGVNVGAWNFNAVTGFGAKHANPLYPGGFIDAGQAVAVSQDSVAVGQTLSALDDQFKAWKWRDDTGFGTRFAHPARVPFAVNALVFSPNSKELFMTRSDAVRMSNRKWDDQSGFGTLYATPATLPTGNPVSVAVV